MHGVETFDVLGQREIVEVVECGDGLVDGDVGIGGILAVMSRRGARHRPRRGISLCVHVSTLTDPRPDLSSHTDIQSSPRYLEQSPRAQCPLCLLVLGAHRRHRRRPRRMAQVAKEVHSICLIAAVLRRDR